MRFGLQDLLSCCVLISVHLGLVVSAYESLSDAFVNTAAGWVWFGSLLAIAMGYLDRSYRNAGPEIFRAPLPRWQRPVWLTAAALDLDLLATLVGFGSPLPFGIARHFLLAFAVVVWRWMATVFVCENGLALYGTFWPWGELRTRLERAEGSDWLLIQETTLGSRLNARFQVPNEEALRLLQEARAKAILNSPQEDNHGSHG